jgi:hypothetical protein
VTCSVESPFLFLGRKSNVELLTSQLRWVGAQHLEIQEPDSPYGPVRVVLTCPWISSLEVIFRRGWWPDGEIQEDRVVFLYVDGAENLVADVGQLLREKLPRPLAEVIAEKLADAVAKSIRSAQQVQATQTSGSV